MYSLFKKTKALYFVQIIILIFTQAIVAWIDWLS